MSAKTFVSFNPLSNRKLTFTKRNKIQLIIVMENNGNRQKMLNHWRLVRLMGQFRGDSCDILNKIILQNI